MDILRDRNVEFDVIEYIKHPLSADELKKYFVMLAVEPSEMLHPGSFAKLGRDIADYSDPDALIALLVEHPEVMNRPLVVRGDRAVIARPAERVEELFD
mgnify:CR=1 FL=1